LSNIGQSECHNPCRRERKKTLVTLWLTNVTNSMSHKCYPNSKGTTSAWLEA